MSAELGITESRVTVGESLNIAELMDQRVAPGVIVQTRDKRGTPALAEVHERIQHFIHTLVGF